MTAAVYVVGGPTDDDRADLRHSLRSVQANAADVTEVWIVGDVPAWVRRAVRMPLDPLPEKFANQRQSLTRLVNYPGAPERFYLFNDDMFVVEPVAGRLPTCRNKNRASGWLAADTQGRPANTWQQAVMATAEWMGERLGADPYIYECHTPLLYDTAKLRDLLNDYPADQPFAVGELYPGAGLGGEGEHCGNAKVARADSLATKLANPMPYLSGNPDSWRGPLGDHIRAMFRAPSKYEEA